MFINCLPIEEGLYQNSSHSCLVESYDDSVCFIAILGHSSSHKTVKWVAMAGQLAFDLQQGQGFSSLLPYPDWLWLPQSPRPLDIRGTFSEREVKQPKMLLTTYPYVVPTLRMPGAYLHCIIYLQGMVCNTFPATVIKWMTDSRTSCFLRGHSILSLCSLQPRLLWF
jgi:hypothetical protein